MSTSATESSPRSHDVRLVNLFLEMMSAERGARRNTLDAYRRDLMDYAASVEVAEAEPDDIRRYMRSLDAGGLAASTQARRLSAVRQFHKFPGNHFVQQFAVFHTW